jgi:hypothetical protein
MSKDRQTRSQSHKYNQQQKQQQNCTQECCTVPLVPTASIKRQERKAHQHSRWDRTSNFWKKVRAVAQPLDKETQSQMSFLTPVLLPPPAHKQRQTLLEQRLVAWVQGAILRSAPQEQLKRSFLVCGPPGTSKTYSIQQTAARLGLTLLTARADDIKSKWVGESGKVLTHLLTLAAQHQPCLVFLDECEGLLRCRQSASQSNDCSMTGNMLTAIQGTQASQLGVFIVCCTNVPGVLDSAVKSRFIKNVFTTTRLEPPVQLVVWSNCLHASQIHPTEKQLQQLVAYGVDDARLIYLVVDEFDALDSTDLRQLFQLLEASMANVASDDELDLVPRDQYTWRKEAPKYVQPRLKGDCTRVSKRIHQSIPTIVKDWMGCLVDSTDLVNSALDSHSLVGQYSLEKNNDEQHSWLIKPDDQKQNVISVTLNVVVFQDNPKTQQQVQELKQQTEELRLELKQQIKQRTDDRLELKQQIKQQEHEQAVQKQLQQTQQDKMLSLTDLYAETLSAQKKEISNLTTQIADLSKVVRQTMSHSLPSQSIPYASMSPSGTVPSLNDEQTDCKNNNTTVQSETQTCSGIIPFRKRTYRSEDGIPLHLDNPHMLRGPTFPDQHVHQCESVLIQKRSVKRKVQVAMEMKLGDQQGGNNLHICSKRRCCRTTTQKKSGKWRHQCNTCLSHVIKKKKTQV